MAYRTAPLLILTGLWPARLRLQEDVALNPCRGQRLRRFSCDRLAAFAYVAALFVLNRRLLPFRSHLNVPVPIPRVARTAR
jgi:hypothetical protein